MSKTNIATFFTVYNNEVAVERLFCMQLHSLLKTWARLGLSSKSLMVGHFCMFALTYSFEGCFTVVLD